MSESEQPPAPREPDNQRDFTSLILDGLGLACVVAALAPILARVRFPWDLLVWAESPFLTDMLKLSAGHPIFAAPSEVNSFVYAPGLHYLTFAILAPFGAATDPIACRIVSVCVGIGAALTSAYATQRVGVVRRGFPSSAAVFFALLVVFGNFTSDIPHPDNLQILHAALTLWLTLLAVERAKAGGSLRWAVAALAWSALGIWAKQPAAASIVGVILAFWVERIAPRRVLIGLTAAGLAMAALSIAVCLAPQFARLYLFDLVAEHGLQWRKIKNLIRVDLATAPHRLLLWGGAALCMVNWARGKHAGGQSFLRTWAILGFFAAGPNLLAYLKTFGEWNNLVIFDLWAAMLVWPVLGYTAESASRPGPLIEAGINLRWVYSGALLAALAIFPRRPAPGAEETAYCERIENSLKADLAAGRRALVAHGAMFAIRAGDKSAPLDRANSWLELNQAGRGDEGGTAARIAEGYYDVIYLNSDWYGPELEAAMRAKYVAAEEWPALSHDRKSAVDTRGLFKKVTVLRRAAAAVASEPN